jgi:RNA polymerase sigma factor (sigma-70 family)
MDEIEWLAERFEQHRPRLRAVAYRMLGSLAEADDTVQDTWIRLSRSNAEQIDNLGGWLTTVVARECLHVLRSRRHRREDSFAAHPSDPIVIADGDLDPEHATCRLPDGVTYLNPLQLEDGVQNPLPALPEGRQFQEKLKSWLAQPASSDSLTIVGSYRLF